MSSTTPDDKAEKGMATSQPNEEEEQPAGSSGADMTPMSVKTEEESTGKKGCFGCGKKKDDDIAGYQKLATENNTRQLSLLALKVAVFCGAFTPRILQPNYPIMVTPGATSESFSSTAPFDFNSATYFIPLTATLGMALSSAFSGQLSDKIGRTKLLKLSALGVAVGSMGKFFARSSFWAFNGVNLFTGLMAYSLPIAMAYIGDIFTSEKEKQKELGVIVAWNMLGQSGGGIIAILMDSTGLFTPLWVGVGFMVIAWLFMMKFLIEPGDVRLAEVAPKVLDEQEEEDGDIMKRPDTIDQKTMWNIIAGALTDNIGSNGLMPLCLSPLMYNQFYVQFEQRGEDPIMSITAYKWISVMVALMVIPGTLITPPLFQRIGAAASCVLGNVITAIVTIISLFLGSAQATTGFFAGLVTVMYVGFPFTVLSQLSTGPMLDVIAPEDKKGYVQGVNSTVMNLAVAFAPWVLGIIADAAGTSVAIWVGIGVSFAAALVNAPLMFHKRMGPAPKKVPAEKRPLIGEDDEMVQKILAGEQVPIEVITAIQDKRSTEGRPFLVIHPTTYEHDKENIDEFNRTAEEVFKYRKEMTDGQLRALADPARRADIPEICDNVNKALATDPDEKKQVHGELGQWFGDYLLDNGYEAQINSVLIKQMILSAFPPIRKDDEFTPDNLEDALLNMRNIYGQYVELRDDRKYTFKSVLGNGARYTFYG